MDPLTPNSMNYHAFCVGIHLYYNPNYETVEHYRDKHAPDARIFAVEYPHHYGWAHRLKRLPKRITKTDQ